MQVTVRELFHVFEDEGDKDIVHFAVSVCSLASANSASGFLLVNATVFVSLFERILAPPCALGSALIRFSVDTSLVLPSGVPVGNS